MCCFDSSAINLELKFNSESAQKNDLLVKAWRWMNCAGWPMLSRSDGYQLSAGVRADVYGVWHWFELCSPLLQGKSSAPGITAQPRVIQPYHRPAPASQTLQAVCHSAWRPQSLCSSSCFSTWLRSWCITLMLICMQLIFDLYHPREQKSPTLIKRKHELKLFAALWVYCQCESVKGDEDSASYIKENGDTLFW